MLCARGGFSDRHQRAKYKKDGREREDGFACARARVRVPCVKKQGRLEKRGTGDDGGRKEWGGGGGSGFCARDDKFGGQRFAPENLSQ